MDREGHWRRYGGEASSTKDQTMGICKRGIAAVSAGLLAGAVVVGAAQADTNWNALSSAGWGGNQVADAGAGGDWSTAIQKAFVDLGMAEPRAECFGRVLAEKLSPETQQEAAELVSDAATATEVKTSVISGGPEMVGGFSAADASCPESLGG
jgi:hypothetical protein